MSEKKYLQIHSNRGVSGIEVATISGLLASEIVRLSAILGDITFTAV